MLVQIYETSSAEEARALADIGVDHIGVLVRDGSFPREQSIDHARLIFSAIPRSCKGVALTLSSDRQFIKRVVSELKPQILQVGASTDLLAPAAVSEIKRQCGPLIVMRSTPVTDAESTTIAQSYSGVAPICCC